MSTDELGFGARATWTLLLLAAAAAGCADDRPTRPAAGEAVVSAGTAADQALIAAADGGDLDELQLQLEAGASVTAVDGRGRTALIAASYGGHVAAARLLIEAGADVNTQDATRQSAYLIATSEIGEAAGLELLRLTLANGADIASLDSYNGTGLIRAADRGFADIVSELLAARVDVDHVNRLGWTALLEAILLGGGDAQHVEVVRRLVDGGADVNLPDGSGVTPLAHARDRGYLEMVGILEAAGAG